MWQKGRSHKGHLKRWVGNECNEVICCKVNCSVCRIWLHSPTHPHKHTHTHTQAPPDTQREDPTAHVADIVPPGLIQTVQVEVEPHPEDEADL